MAFPPSSENEIGVNVGFALQVDGAAGVGPVGALVFLLAPVIRPAHLYLAFLGRVDGLPGEELSGLYVSQACHVDNASLLFLQTVAEYARLT